MSTPGKKGKKGGAPTTAPPPASTEPIVDDEKDEGKTAPQEVEQEKANDAATGLTNEETGEPVELVRYSFDILANIKGAQLQNGLRHGDYQRYRQYCARRLRRLRVGLKFTHHKREFKVKPIEPNEVDDVRYLAIPLVNAERCWSYAMQLKNDMTQETKRKRFHLLKRLTKAASWSTQLEQLCAVRADTRTQLQAEAYASWMNGSILFEREQHEKALAKFLHAKTVYEKLGSIGGSSMQILCEERVASLADSIRFCKYMLRNKSGSSADDDDEVSALGGGNNDLLSSKLEELRQERMLEKAKNLDTIEWQGKTIPVSNDKLRVCFVEAKSLTEQLEKVLAQDKTGGAASSSSASSSAGKKDGSETATDGSPESQNLSLIYQKLFGAYDDALKIVRDSLLEPKMLEAHKAHLAALKEYSTASRLEIQCVRNNQFIANVAHQLRQQEKNPDEYRTKKKVKADEVVLLYEKLLQALQELSEIQTANKNTTQTKILATRILGAQSARAYYLAESYRRLKKYIESWLLYGRSLELADEFQKSSAKLGADSKSFANEIESVTILKKEAAFSRGTVHAQALLEEAEKQAKLAKGVAGLKLDESAVAIAPPASQSLLARLDQWESGSVNNQHHLVDFPPEFQAAPAKPILFDLAYNAIQYPDISAKLKKLEASKKAAAAPTPAATKAEPKKVAVPVKEPAPAVKKETPAPTPAPAPVKKQPTPAKKPEPEPEPEEESEEEEEAPPQKKPAAKQPTKPVEPEEEEEEPVASSTTAQKPVKQPAAAPAKKVIAPPGEKESVKRERERLAKEEEERKKKEAEEAKKKQGWGFGGLVGKIWGGK